MALILICEKCKDRISPSSSPVAVGNEIWGPCCAPKSKPAQAVKITPSSLLLGEVNVWSLGKVIFVQYYPSLRGQMHPHFHFDKGASVLDLAVLLLSEQIKNRRIIVMHFCSKEGMDKEKANRELYNYLREECAKHGWQTQDVEYPDMPKLPIP